MNLSVNDPCVNFTALKHINLVIRSPTDRTNVTAVVTTILITIGAITNDERREEMSEYANDRRILRGDAMRGREKVISTDRLIETVAVRTAGVKKKPNDGPLLETGIVMIDRLLGKERRTAPRIDEIKTDTIVIVVISKEKQK